MDRLSQLEKCRKLRINPDSPVRRKLFDSPDDVTAITGVENFNNAMQERFERETIEMSKKYNYDFQNDVPHPYANGRYNWYQKIDGAWVGIEVKQRERSNSNKTLAEIDLNKESKKSAQDLKRENEMTPKSFSQGDLPRIKKKKSDDSFRGGAKKRRLSF